MKKLKITNLDRLKNENNKQYIYRVLKENIMNLQLVPGESVSEIEISEALSVSRTPVREAMVHLSEEKLIDVFPQKGSSVSEIDLNLVEEAVFLRELCEREIFKIVCKKEDSMELLRELEKNVAYQKIAIGFDEDLYAFFKLDNQFHKLIFEYCNKKNIWNSISKLSTHYDRLRLLDSLEKVNLQEVLNQHMEIIQTLKNKETDKIDVLIRKHLYNYKDVIEVFIERYPTYFKR